MIEDEYGHAIYLSNVRRIAELNLYVREHNIHIDKMAVLAGIYDQHIRKIDREHQAWCRKNPYRTGLPDYASFHELPRVQLDYIAQYWDMFD